MGILKHLLDRASADTWQMMVALALSILFPALVALALWPAGRAGLALKLLSGFGILWLVAEVIHLLTVLLHKRFRVDLYSHPDAFFITNALASVLLMALWTAFAALAVHEAAAGAGLWLAAGLHLVGLLSGVVACQVVGSFYTGGLYKMAALAAAVAGYALFAAWPAAAGAAFGWLFRFFRLF